ncbi:MAG: response regulator transcription factor [Acetobacteraceae bacterium]|nr:response regulator transcription factor [Acetobacteraceae bacterium]
MAAFSREGVSGEVVALDADTADAAQRTGPYDAVLLEAPALEQPLLAILRALARRRLGIPILVFTNRTTPEAEAEALDIGADDVLLAPVSASMLVVRLRSLRRRILGHLTATLRCGNTVVDQARGRVLVDGAEIRVTRREFDVLELLLLHRGTLVSKEEFMQRLYGLSEGPDSRTLDVFVCKLRRKLAAAGAAEFIRTTWSRGYTADEPTEAGIALARARHAEGALRRPTRLTRPALAWSEIH